MSDYQQSNHNEYQQNRSSNHGGNGYPNNSNGYNSGGSRSNSNGGGGYQRGGGNQNQKYRKPAVDTSEGVLYKPFVITGNRDAPTNVVQTMQRLVTMLESEGWTTRTGGLEGPDEAIESVSTRLELALPWQGFNGKECKNYFATTQSKDIAAKYHTGFDTLKPAIQAFLAKNVRMVCGRELKSPALIVIIWSADGVESDTDRTPRTGNVGHIVSVANAMHIPVFNLGSPTAEARLIAHLKLQSHKDTPNGTISTQQTRTDDWD